MSQHQFTPRKPSGKESQEEWHELLQLAADKQSSLLTDGQPLQCELITPVSAADRIWTEWRQLMLQVPQEQQLSGPDWFRVWAATWGTTGRWTGQPSIITARNSAGMLLGLLTLGRPRIGPMAAYSSGGHSVPHRGIVSVFGMESAVGSAIGRFVADRNWPLMQIGPILSTGKADQTMLQQLQDEQIFLHHHDGREEITLHAADSWEEYCRTQLSRRHVRRMACYERRINRDGQVDIRHYRQTSPEETREMFNALQTVEAASWMATRPDAVPRFTNDALRDFWQQQTLEFLAPQDHLDCWILWLDDRPVSFCFTLTSGRTRYVIANNYDNALKVYRTGTILYRHMIQEGIERDVRRFAFADGSFHYKSRWGAKVDGSRDTWLAIPNRPLGYVASVTTHLQRQFSLADADPRPVSHASAQSGDRPAEQELPACPDVGREAAGPCETTGLQRLARLKQLTRGH